MELTLSRSLGRVASQVTVALALLAACADAHGQELGVHATGGGGHAVSSPQSQRFGWGGGATLAVAAPLTHVFALQLEAGAMALSQSRPSSDPTIASHSTGTVFNVMAGLRVHPFGATRVAGLWLDANGGLVATGNQMRPGFDAHIGYDMRISDGRWDVGPFIGYTQVVQTASGLAPDDARIVWLGVHVGVGAQAKPPRLDTDRDMVWDDEDACPRIAGVRTVDWRTNGCPRRERAAPVIVAAPAPPPPQEEPPLLTPVRLEQDHIVVDERVHFEIDRAEVMPESYLLLRDVATVMTRHPELELVEVEGHADERGSEEYNLALSARRAEAVRVLLVSFGVADDRLVAHGYGESRPRIVGHAEEHFSRNRRVEFNVVRKTSQPAAHASTAITGGGQ